MIKYSIYLKYSKKVNYLDFGYLGIKVVHIVVRDFNPDFSSKEKQNEFCFANKMRFSHKKSLVGFILIITSILTWNILSKQFEKSYTQTCNQLGKYQEDLHVITDRVHRILQVLNLTHFLCYGSLWGQIRLSRLLPWEDKSVICLLNEDIANKDAVTIIRSFKKEGFYISYDLTRGQYVVTQIKGDEKMKVLLILFEMNKIHCPTPFNLQAVFLPGSFSGTLKDKIHMYRRIGWFRRLLPPACESFETLDCFPPRLVAPPLPMKEFGRNLIPVPREGIEIQKYHYKDDWWKEIPLKNC